MSKNINNNQEEVKTETPKNRTVKKPAQTLLERVKTWAIIALVFTAIGCGLGYNFAQSHQTQSQVEIQNITASTKK